ncbi:3D domain-containing protein [Clostridium sp. BJN0001]|uniref:3D domain-containing protein n=1 Tax=Clostridium sp. BJN0001 TaxID=2930219 RepID=UPI001FD419BD|nr:3D domain-containing protein [Clostridium sp. BJN0001]
MVEKLNDLTRKIKTSFSNSPKKRLILGTSVAVAAVLIMTSAVIINLRKTVILNLDGKQEMFVTYKGTVKDVLLEKGVNVGTYDKVEPSLKTKVAQQCVIDVKNAKPVEIVANGESYTVNTAENTVKDMLMNNLDQLSEKGVDFDEDKDEITPSLDSEIVDDMSVKLTKVEQKEVTEKQQIAFDTVVEKDSKLDSTVNKVKQEGSSGEKEITYTVTYKDGKECAKEVKSTKTIVEPTNKVIVQGTGQVYVSRGSGSVAYKRKLNCEATAYSGGYSTKTGRTPIRNVNGMSTIAVDPSVIPLGSKVYIDGYGYAVAADTGSAIKGNIIDLYFNSYGETVQWGRKPVTVLILAYPGEW